MNNRRSSSSAQNRILSQWTVTSPCFRSSNPFQHPAQSKYSTGMCAPAIKKRDKNIICFVATKKTFLHLSSPHTISPTCCVCQGPQNLDLIAFLAIFSSVCSAASDVGFSMFLRCNSLRNMSRGRERASDTDSDSSGQIQSTRKNGWA